MNDQIYIDNIKAQVASGMYDKLFNDMRDLVFLDIGANVGIVSIYAVPYCKRIVAVEPSPLVFETLGKNTRDYSIIERERLALAGSTGTHEFFVNDINFTASSTVNTYGTRIIVQCITLGDLLEKCALTHVDVCKIDCEGCEGEALNFMQLERASKIIDRFFIEFHNCPKTDWQHKLGTTVSYLSRLGYENQEINGMSLTATKVN